MPDFLSTILAHKRDELVAISKLDADRIKRCAETAAMEASSTRSLKKSMESSHRVAIISEFKRRSPSKGWIREEATPANICPAYEQAGAAALSILTDRDFFGGSVDFVSTVRPLVKLPILRKDFIIDPLQVYETKAIGADALLLIAACLSPAQTKELTELAHSLDIEVLLEIHNESELGHICEGIDVVGINNRNLQTFNVNIETSLALVNSLPSDSCKISESGLTTTADLKRLQQAGFNGFLIGERLMRATDPAEALRTLIKNFEE